MGLVLTEAVDDINVVALVVRTLGSGGVAESRSQLPPAIGNLGKLD